MIAGRHAPPPARNPQTSRFMTTSATGASADLVPLSALFADVETEFDSTRRLLANFPDEHADWKPHEKSMSLVALAAHVASLPELGRAIAEQPEWNAAETPYVQPTARTREELLALFDRKVEGARRAIASLDAPKLEGTWRMRNGDVEYFSGKRGTLLRRFLVSHTAHHRGQLTVYYRMLDVPVPGMYGPTADGM